MAYKKRRKGKVSGNATNTILIVGGVAVLAFVAYNMVKPSTTTVIHTTTPTSTSSSTTAAEIAAGAGVASSLLNDLFGGDNS